MHNRRAVLGADPGKDGGLALLILGPNGEPEEVLAIVMPTKPGAKGREVDGQQIGYFIGEAYEKYEADVVAVAVESVHSMPKQGVASSFDFGYGYGKLMGVLENEELPISRPTPVQWKKVVLDGLGREKQDAVRWVLNHWPKVNLKDETKPKAYTNHDGKAEAICLAEYARLEYLGILQQVKMRKGKGGTTNVKPTADVKDTPKPPQVFRPRVYPETGFDGFIWTLEYMLPNGRKNALKLENDYREALAEAAAYLKLPESAFDYFEHPPDDDETGPDARQPVQVRTAVATEGEERAVKLYEELKEQEQPKKRKAAAPKPPKPAAPPKEKKEKKAKVIEPELAGFDPPPTFGDIFDF